LYLCCYVGGDGCKLILELLEFYLFISPQVKFVLHGLGQAVYAGEGGLDAQTLPRPPNSSGGVNFFGIMYSWIYMNFDHSEHLSEGSRLNSCTSVVMLVVMVANSHWSYLNFHFYFCSSEACSSWFGPGWACLERGVSVPRPSQGPPNSSGRLNHF
jgi:hypothetical protein